MKAFNADRDINITNSEVNVNQSQSTKTFHEAADEELVQDRTHRRSLLNKEQSKKSKTAKPLFITATVLLGFTMIVQFLFEDYIHILITGFTALGGIGSFWAAGQLYAKKSEFELRQEQAIKEITFILKEREVE